jgi:hypothetical protein
MTGSAKQSILFICGQTDCCARNDGRAEFGGLACGTHARNMRASIAPYSYGLAAHARRIYNGVACSGGQGGRSSRRTLPLEATRPGLLGTPGLVYSPHRSGRAPIPPLDPRHHRNRKNNNATRGHRTCVAGDQNDPCSCSMTSSTTITRMTWDDLANDPADRAFGFGAPDAGLRSPEGFNAGDGPAGQAELPRPSGFQIHLRLLLQRRDFGVLRVSPCGTVGKKRQSD